MIEAKDTLGWCFTLGAMSLGVFGFAFSTYASALIAHPTEPPPIVDSLRWFCRLLMLALIAISALTIAVAYQACAPTATWVLVCVLAVTTLLCAVLTIKMRH
jgi:heme/copper-type cytochrome/quinol oxidase subunit 3